MSSTEPSVQGGRAPGEVLPPALLHDHARRRRQTYTFVGLITAVLLAGLVALGSWLQWWTIGGRAAAAPPSLCPAQTVTDPALTGVKVYNGTRRPGLAAAVAKELQVRGFKVLTITTEGQSRPLQAIALIRYGEPGAISAHTVALQFPGAVKLAKDARKSRTVDVVLGQKYQGLKSRKKAAAAIAPAPQPENCTPRQESATPTPA